MVPIGEWSRFLGPSFDFIDLVVLPFFLNLILLDKKTQKLQTHDVWPSVKLEGLE